jgi:hypothetical protein
MPTGTRPQAPAGTLRVALSGLISTHKWVNVFYCQLTHTVAVTVNDLESILNGIVDLWGGNMMASLTTNVTLQQADGVFIPSVGQSLQWTHTETKTGLDANIIQDASACAVVDWLISDYYRGGHPRTYLPGPSSSGITNASQLGATIRSNIAANAETTRNGINALTSTNVTAVTMGTVRFQSAKAWLSPPVFRPYTGSKVRSVLGSQRRRLTA